MKNCVIILSLFLTFTLKSAELKNPLVFGNNRITIITDGLLRLEYAVHGRFHDDKTMFAVNRNALSANFNVVKKDSITYIITTPKMKIIYRADNYPFGGNNFNIEFDNAGKKGLYNTRKSAFPSPENLKGAIATLDRIDGPCELDEGLLSRDGYYMIDDTGKERIVDGWISPASTAHVQDYYVFIYGDDYRSALQSLGAISGKAPMNRKYMHGAWYCRFFNYNADDYRQIVKGYKENNFPLDVLVFDMDWHTMDAKIGSGHGGRLGWTGYTWNKNQFPDPKALLAEFKQDGIVVPLNDHPADGIRPNEEKYNAFMLAMGLDPKKDTPPIFDASNKRYMENFFKYALKPNEQIGAAFWWLDWQQDYIQPYVRGTKTKHLPWLNHLYYTHSLEEGQRGVIYSRWGGWGSQRYPIQFSGDTYASWESLAFQVEMTSTSGNAGCFFWAHDIGGHYKGTEAEMYVRWAQFGALSSTLRVHSSGNSPDRRPWLWGDWATEAMRRAYHLRSELMPYIYSSLWQTHQNMIPFNRAMYIDYPKQQSAYNNPQQYMFGDNILVAPIASQGEGEQMVAKQKVWFPKGDDWFGYYDNKAYKGGTESQYSCSINDIPIFIKGGVMIPMQPYTDRMATKQIDTLRTRVYPALGDVTNSYTLYEDDGMSLDYENGKFATTELVCMTAKDELKLTVRAAKGDYQGQPKSRAVIFEVAHLGEGAKIEGKNIKVKKEGDITYISTPRRSISEEVCIVVKKPYLKK